MENIASNGMDGLEDNTPASVAADRMPRRARRKSDAANILVVDDDRASRIAMTAILAGIGDRVVCVESGEEALRCLLREDYAIILLDVIMSEMTGYKTAELIRRRERSRYVPIIFMSAVNKDQRHMFEGYSAGAVDYVFKPVEPIVLRSKVAVFVELHRKSVALRHKAETEKRLLMENLRVRTEQMRTAEALHRSLAQQSLIIDALPIAFYTAPASEGFTRRRYVGGRTSPLFGFAPERFEQQPGLWFDRIHDLDRDGVGRSLARFAKTGQFYAEYRWHCGNGTWRNFLDHGMIVRKEGGGAAEMFGTSLDITDRRSLEHQLAHAQKMEVLGQLTSGIAHDFNNMLTVIFSSLDRLQQTVETGSPMARYADMAMRGALSCADLTRRLLGFARRHPLQPKPINLNAEIARLWDLLGRMLEANMQMRQRCATGLWTVIADPLQIEAALMNLIVNARDAMPDDGVVTISTRNRVVDARMAAAAEIPPGEYVELTVSDTGAGMSAEVREHAFDPFFTTKQPGKGTGLGLSTIYGFIRQSNGGIVIESEVGRGTKVRLYLPRAETVEAVPEPPVAPMAEPIRDNMKVLAVDDDREVLDVAVGLLESLGYTVVDAEDGPSALALIEADPAISLLFTDWAMPDMDGRELAAKASLLRPDLPVLFTSGNADLFFSGVPTPTDVMFVAKPYRQHDLDAAVRTVLAASQKS
jgi:signal transduction histidine kinase